MNDIFVHATILLYEMYGGNQTRILMIMNYHRGSQELACSICDKGHNIDQHFKYNKQGWVSCSSTRTAITHLLTDLILHADH